MSSTIFMFIPFLKQLMTDVDSGPIKQVEDILRANKIPYRIKTSSWRGPIGRYYDSRTYSQITMPLYIDAQKPTLSYVIYVRKRDFKKAKGLIGSLARDLS
ncbi:MAG: hypothetical protein GX773_07405 [Chloroflexi bacterium]|nr:hypothetical protein [Chloroflexota bacterium]HZK17059.1 hypothetical protein [Anaerolineaceae bacterium]